AKPLRYSSVHDLSPSRSRSDLTLPPILLLILFVVFLFLELALVSGAIHSTDSILFTFLSRNCGYSQLKFDVVLCTVSSPIVVVVSLVEWLKFAQDAVHNGFDAVAVKAENLMLKRGENKEYLPNEGLAAFNKATAELLHGADNPP
ncbi:aspartate aminotransferase, partial [Trifolium pratense]